MELHGEMMIGVPRTRVWEALNDPEILAACVDGCERLERSTPDTFTGALKVRIGPIRATFEGNLVFKDIDAPNGYTINGAGKGGASGFASGEARVALADIQGGTLLKYDVIANVGGKLAQVGGRLIESVTKKYVEGFFLKFKTLLEPEIADFPIASPQVASSPLVAANRWKKFYKAIPLILAFIIAAFLIARFAHLFD